MLFKLLLKYIKTKSNLVRSFAKLAFLSFLNIYSSGSSAYLSPRDCIRDPMPTFAASDQTSFVEPAKTPPVVLFLDISKIRNGQQLTEICPEKVIQEKIEKPMSEISKSIRRSKSVATISKSLEKEISQKLAKEVKRSISAVNLMTSGTISYVNSGQSLKQEKVQCKTSVLRELEQSRQRNISRASSRSPSNSSNNSYTPKSESILSPQSRQERVTQLFSPPPKTRSIANLHRQALSRGASSRNPSLETGRRSQTGTPTSMTRSSNERFFQGIDSSRKPFQRINEPSSAKKICSLHESQEYEELFHQVMNDLKQEKAINKRIVHEFILSLKKESSEAEGLMAFLNRLLDINPETEMRYIDEFRVNSESEIAVFSMIFSVLASKCDQFEIFEFLSLALTIFKERYDVFVNPRDKKLFECKLKSMQNACKKSQNNREEIINLINSYSKSDFRERSSSRSSISRR